MNGVRGGWFLLVFAIALASACGENAEVTHPTVPSLSPSASASSAPAATDAGAADAAPAPIVMKPLAPSQLGKDLEALGLDPKNLPAFAKLEPTQLRKLMPLFARSLGVKCRGCHAEDMAAPTPNKRVAAKMWDEFVRKVTQDDGSPVFCDSCHQGRSKLVDRADKKATEEWMNHHFTSGLKRKDGKEEDCASCHGDPEDKHFLDGWRKP